MANAGAWHPLPNYPSIQIVVVIWSVHAQIDVPSHRLTLSLHAPESNVEAVPLSDGPRFVPVEVLVSNDPNPLWPLRLVDP